MIAIRKAILKDIEQLTTLFNAYRVFYEQTSDLEKAKKFLNARIKNNESTIFLAKWNGVTCGFTQLYKTFSSVSVQHSWILNDLYVDTAVRGKGIGESLLKHAQKFATEDGAKGLALETAMNNPAQKLYERLGWKKDEEYFHYFWTAT